MGFLSRSRPSPMMLVAAVALTAAFAGTAIAGTDAATSALNKGKVKKIAKKQANKVLNGREAALNVNSAKTADSATRATLADRATRATEADSATNAQNAQNAQNAVNANNANNANSLGGIPASGFVQRFFAKVQYNSATPVILSGSAGVTASGEGALGFPRITFPRSMDACAIIATTSAAAGTSIVRHSTGTGGALVQLAIQDGANAPVRTNFSIVGIC